MSVESIVRNKSSFLEGRLPRLHGHQRGTRLRVCERAGGKMISALLGLPRNNFKHAALLKKKALHRRLVGLGVLKRWGLGGSASQLEQALVPRPGQLAA